MVYKCMHGLAPRCLAVGCVPVTSLASWHLQSAESGCLVVTGARTALGTRNFAVAGAKICYSLSTADTGIICLSAMSASEDFNSCYVNELIIIIIIIKYLLYLRDGYVFEVIGSKVIRGQGWSCLDFSWPSIILIVCLQLGYPFENTYFNCCNSSRLVCYLFNKRS